MKKWYAIHTFSGQENNIKKHIEQIKSFHETDKDVAAIKNKQKAVRKKRTDADSKKAADDIFSRFKNGEKLSTEDLMALQKSGYL